MHLASRVCMKSKEHIIAKLAEIPSKLNYNRYNEC